MSHKSRRILGTIIGLAMGLAYSLVAQNINSLSLRGIPLYEPQPGKINTDAHHRPDRRVDGSRRHLTEDALPGVLLSAVVGITASTLLNIYLTEQGVLQIAGALIVFFMTSCPAPSFFYPWQPSSVG